MGNRDKKQFKLFGYTIFPSDEGSRSASSPFLSGQRPPEHGNSEAFHLQGPSKLVNQSKTSNEILGNCTLNQNLADFNLPDENKEFARTAKGFRIRESSASKRKSLLSEIGGTQKRRLEIIPQGKTAEENSQ